MCINRIARWTAICNYSTTLAGNHSKTALAKLLNYIVTSGRHCIKWHERQCQCKPEWGPPPKCRNFRSVFWQPFLVHTLKSDNLFTGHSPASSSLWAPLPALSGVTLPVHRHTLSQKEVQSYCFCDNFFVIRHLVENYQILLKSVNIWLSFTKNERVNFWDTVYKAFHCL